MNYYDVKLPSYSYFSKLLTPFEGNQSDLEFGREFHRALLEPKMPGKTSDLARQMVKKCHDYFGYEHFYGKGVRREWEYYKHVDGLLCKGKIDRVSSTKNVITDYKTSGIYSSHQISNIIDSYNYDLQAYMYLNLEGNASVYQLVFVQKSKNPLIFIDLIYRDSFFYWSGQKKFKQAWEIHKTFGFM